MPNDNRPATPVQPPDIYQALGFRPETLPGEIHANCKHLLRQRHNQKLQRNVGALSTIAAPYLSSQFLTPGPVTIIGCAVALACGGLYTLRRIHSVRRCREDADDSLQALAQITDWNTDLTEKYASLLSDEIVGERKPPLIPVPVLRAAGDIIDHLFMSPIAYLPK